VAPEPTSGKAVNLLVRPASFPRNPSEFSPRRLKWYCASASGRVAAFDWCPVQKCMSWLKKHRDVSSHTATTNCGSACVTGAEAIAATVAEPTRRHALHDAPMGLFAIFPWCAGVPTLADRQVGHRPAHHCWCKSRVGVCGHQALCAAFSPSIT
jgi:hypothetical protein